MKKLLHLTILTSLLLCIVLPTHAKIDACNNYCINNQNFDAGSSLTSNCTKYYHKAISLPKEGIYCCCENSLDKMPHEYQELAITESKDTEEEESSPKHAGPVPEFI